MENGVDWGAVATRMVQLRKAYEGDDWGSSKRFAEKRLGISQPRWTNFEKGYPISRDMALRIVQKCPGVTTDWIWRGSETGITVDFARKLAQLDSSPTSETG